MEKQQAKAVKKTKKKPSKGSGTGNKKSNGQMPTALPLPMSQPGNIQA